MSSESLRQRGNLNIDTSCFLKSEKTLKTAVKVSVMQLKQWMKQNNIPGKIKIYNKITSSELYKFVGFEDDPNDKTYGQPDGGIVFWEIDGKKYLILVSEDKCQGTNDRRRIEGKSKQALGNSIERAFKNQNFFALLVLQETIYPYIIFCSGCDFDPSETISNRLRQGNFGKKNIRGIDIYKDFSIEKFLKIKDTSTVFIKSHSWKEEQKNWKRWSTPERTSILFNTMKKAVTYYNDKYFKNINEVNDLLNNFKI